MISATRRQMILSRSVAIADLLEKDGITSDLCSIGESHFTFRFRTSQVLGPVISPLIAKIYNRWDDVCDVTFYSQNDPLLIIRFNEFGT